MIKKLFSFFALAVAIIAAVLYYSNTIQSPFISALNNTKLAYLNSLENLSDSIDRHFKQADRIKELEGKLQLYEHNHLLMQKMATELNDIFALNGAAFNVKPEAQLIRSISYQKFNEQNRIWMDVPKYNPSKIYGFVYNELVAGIIVPHNNKPLGLLNRDIKCSYSVFIGQNETPGIAHGNNSKYLVIDYIPGWHIIKKGDLVVTSGLDGLFFKGLKVGKVISFSKSQGYQSAVVEPFYQSSDPNYFYMITN